MKAAMSHRVTQIVTDGRQAGRWYRFAQPRANGSDPCGIVVRRFGTARKATGKLKSSVARL